MKDRVLYIMTYKEKLYIMTNKEKLLHLNCLAVHSNNICSLSSNFWD